MPADGLLRHPRMCQESPVCVAAAFCGDDGWPIGAISTSGPRWRVTEEIVGAMGAALMGACKSLGELL